MKAIDVHAHPSTAPFSRDRMWGHEVAQSLYRYYRITERVRSDEEMAEEFRELDIKALIIGWDA